MLIQWFRRKKACRQTGERLYQAALAQSREPAFYTSMGVADTMDGRFDLLSLHVILLIDRLNGLGKDGVRAGQAVFDAMFKRMDIDLREMGIGDLGVPKHMQKMMKAFNGRHQAYHDAFQSGNVAAIELSLARNVYRMQGEAVPDGAPILAVYTADAVGRLKSATLEDFNFCAVQFPPVASAMRQHNRAA